MKALHYEAVAADGLIEPSELEFQARQALRPFVVYLNHAIKGAERRQTSYQVRCTPIVARRRIQLEPLDTLVEVRLPAGGWRVLDWPGTSVRTRRARWSSRTATMKRSHSSV